MYFFEKIDNVFLVQILGNFHEIFHKNMFKAFTRGE
jgi:hypothetical protein